MATNKHIFGLALVAAVITVSCIKEPTPYNAVQKLCLSGNPVYVIHRDNDSALYWIPNCFAPGDSLSPNDSLVEFEKNIAQAIVSITDSQNNVMVYDVYNFQGTGFGSHKIWDGNYEGNPAGEKCYLLQVSGTTLFGTSFNLTGTVSLLRYFMKYDTLGIKNKSLIKCDSCFFNTQWSGSAFNPLLPNNENLVQDTLHQCY